METRQIQRQQFLATASRQRFVRHPKPGKAGESRHFVWHTVRLLGMAPIRLRRRFSIRGDVPQVFLHQRPRKEPTHSCDLDRSAHHRALKVLRVGKLALIDSKFPAFSLNPCPSLVPLLALNYPRQGDLELVRPPLLA